MRNYLSGFLLSARMRQRGILLSVILLGVATGLQEQGLFAKDAVTWIERYDEALEVARETGKPIFLEFRCAP